MKVTLSEMKNLQGTNGGGDKVENQLNSLEHKEEKNHSIRTAGRKNNFLKKDRLSSLWDISKCTNTWIIGMPEGEEEEEEIENLFEKLNRENFLKLVKEIDIQVQEAESP